jgi:hypothetical protein
MIFKVGDEFIVVKSNNRNYQVNSIVRIIDIDKEGDFRISTSDNIHWYWFRLHNEQLHYIGNFNIELKPLHKTDLLVNIL